MNALWQDLRYSLRMLAQRPGFTAVAVLTLALGIGANSAIFTLSNALLWRPVPGVEQPDQLVTVYTSDFSSSRYRNSSYPDFLDFRAQCQALAGLAAFVDFQPINLSTGSESQRVFGALVTGDYFPVLGVKAIQGRTLLPEDDKTLGGHPVAVISYSLWQRYFGGEPGLVGKNISLNGHSFTVVGITAQDFKGTRLDAAPEVWVPMTMIAQVAPGRSAGIFTRRSSRWLRMVGRLKPGATLAQAQTQLDTIMAQLAKAYPQSNLGTLQQPRQPRPITALAISQAMIWPDAREGTKQLTQLLMVTVGLVLLIACANIANLLLARAQQRQKEMAVRFALGASRLRILRQMMTESLLLSLMGGAIGLLLALWVSDLLLSLNRFSSFVALKLSLDLRVLSFTMIIAVLTSMLFGLVPALQASKPDLVSALKNAESIGGRVSRRFGLRHLLVIPQVALSLVLLIGAGLFLRSLQKAYATDLGFNVEQALLASVDVTPQGYNEARGRAFYQQLEERVAALPGTSSVTFASFVPIEDNGNREGVIIEGYTPRENEDVELNFNVVGLKYFQTMGIPLLLGRDFTAQDDATAPKVVIINEAMARRYWPGQSPIGKHFYFGGTQGPLLEVIGMAKTIKYRDLREAALPYMYLPFAQQYRPNMTLVIRTSSDPTGLIPALRAGVRTIDPNIPLFDVETLTEHMGTALAPERANAALIGIFALLALLLASIGLYGVMSYTVTQRTHEIGIRMALGAQRRDVLKLIVGQGIRLTLIGISIGLVAAFTLTRFLSSLLFSVAATDLTTFALITLLLAGVALLACYLPARRAAKVDPMIALRYE